ncbi:sugar ABC transporter ATP-binding protein [Alicyclobacillus fastidiosus]|uniref:sugar ABC transporter ATP-binding protein n=1 Tax=Alicyclobacillus fastidiosus TaxID=392011 RepID=UPI0023E9304A|nr:sugar ABC transporter ATP-binding protein [Alicyclobacillus fastidiosus]GMA61602.1 ribose import ATP-binding protein RbsA [Alicyclobacillus fastidiosus]
MVSTLRMKGINKSFAGVRVLDDVELLVEGGKVVALLGENGAGKSTLMKILTGEYQADAGEISIDDQVVSIRNIDDAKRHRIGMIHQELNLFPNLSIAENFLIGNEEEFKKTGFIRNHKLKEKVSDILNQVNLHRDPSELVKNLGIGEQQLVEIGKALLQDVKYLVMDEPTAALTESETERLFQIIESLKQNGVGIIYISHRMEELYKIADQVSVLRDGQFIATRDMKTADENELVSMMVGRTVAERYPKTPSKPGETLLRALNIKTPKVKRATIEVKVGEIVGLGGLMGAGRTELVSAFAGVDKILEGEFEFKGKRVRFKSPKQAIDSGIAFVTEDRKSQGLILPFSVRDNMALPTLNLRNKLGFIQSKKEKSFAAEMVKKLRIKVASTEQPAGSLSGGNQQKIVIGKWMAQDPALLILDEPTRGIDVGAKQEIYELMNAFKGQGRGILMISSDLPELMGICDRIYVMHEGEVMGEIKGEDMNNENFMKLATGRKLS